MRTFKFISLTLALGAMALIGCSKDTTATVPGNPVPEPETKVLKVIVSNTVAAESPASAPSKESRATLTDGIGFNWEGTDDQQFYAFVSGTNGATKSNGIEIDTEGNAAFMFNAAIKADREMWFLYGTPNIAGAKNECSITASQTQKAPGVMDKTYLSLRTQLTPISEDSQIVMPTMTLVGSVQRFLIYSATGLYTDEKVQSASMTSSENIAGIFGYNSAGQPVGMDGNPVDKETLYWNLSKTISVAVETPKAIAATGRDQTLHHGIYMSIAPVSLPAGYSYVITTDKAIYTMTSPTAKTLTNGSLSNVFVNLENANVHRVDLTALKLRYAGGLGDNYSVSFDAGKSGLGYYVAYVHDGVSETQHATFPADAKFYGNGNVTFPVTDEEGNPVTWLTCAYRANDTWWDATYEANMGPARTAVITATFNVPGYNCTTPTKVVRITQAAYTMEKILTYQNKALGNVTWDKAATDKNTGCWFVAYINGSPKDGGFHDEPYYRNVEYTTEPAVDWVTFHLPPNSNNIWANVQANDTDAVRSTTVTVKYTGNDGFTVSETDRIVGTFLFTQNAQ